MKERKPKSNSKVKKILLILLPILALLSTVVGLIFMGIIKVPFYKPTLKGTLARKEKKPTPAAQVAPVKPKPAPKPVAPTPAAPKRKPVPTSDPLKGASQIARVWDEMEPQKLSEITQDWKEPALAVVLARMDSEKVAELLAALPPKRASVVSRAIQVEAAKLTAAESAAAGAPSH